MNSQNTQTPAETKSTENAPSFRKTKSGKWAVMGPVETLQKALDGDGKVDVLKKSGDWSSYTVVSLGKPFDVDGTSMCYGYDTVDEQPSQQGGGDIDLSKAPVQEDGEPLPQFQGSEEDTEAPF